MKVKKKRHGMAHFKNWLKCNECVDIWTSICSRIVKKPLAHASRSKNSFSKRRLLKIVWRRLNSRTKSSFQKSRRWGQRRRISWRSFARRKTCSRTGKMASIDSLADRVDRRKKYDKLRWMRSWYCLTDSTELLAVLNYFQKPLKPVL